MKLFVSSFVAIFVLCACDPNPSAEVTANPTETPATPVALVIEETSINIGDVEAVVSIALTVSTESRGPQVSVEDIITPNAREILGMSNVTVTAPYPETLVAAIGVFSVDNFADRPVALRGKILREGTQIGTFSTVLGKYATGRVPAGVVPMPKLAFTADVFQGMSTMPDTMLIFAEVEAFLLPSGTDESTVDPLTVTTSVENKTVIRSNPMRVDFVGVGGVQ